MAEGEYRDRNQGYVPTDLSTMRRSVEVNRGSWNGEGRYENPRMAEVTMGLADELNRYPSRWWWARMDQGEVEHWSHFEGHFVQVDVELGTYNERSTNSWKGRDEVRKAGEWRLKLNRIQVFSGDFADPLEALLTIRRTLQKLLDHPAFTEWTQAEVDALEGRKVYYRGIPAVIERQLIYAEGRIVLVPEGDAEWPPSPWAIEEDLTWDTEREVVTTLLDPGIHWWRRGPRPEPTPVETVTP